MKKTIGIFAVMAALVVALVYTGFVSAQGSTPPTPQTPGSGYGRGGMMGGRMAQAGMDGEGILHDTMMTVYAEKLGMTADALNARVDKGETMAQIATAQGLTAQQFTALMREARSQAAAQAVKDGTLTQTQADGMQQRGAGTMGGNMRGGAGRGMGGMHGGGAGNVDCPYFPQAQ